MSFISRILQTMIQTIQGKNQGPMLPELLIHQRIPEMLFFKLD
jgi:hypothetical protein